MKLLCTEKCFINGHLYRDGHTYEFDQNPNPERFIDASHGKDELIKTSLKENTRDLGLTPDEYDLIVEKRKGVPTKAEKPVPEKKSTSKKK